MSFSFVSVSILFLFWETFSCPVDRATGWIVSLSVSIGWVSSTLNELWEGFCWRLGLIAGELALEVGMWMRLLRSASDMLSKSESESELTGSQ